MEGGLRHGGKKGFTVVKEGKSRTEAEPWRGKSGRTTFTSIPPKEKERVLPSSTSKSFRYLQQKDSSIVAAGGELGHKNRKMQVDDDRFLKKERREPEPGKKKNLTRAKGIATIPGETKKKRALHSASIAEEENTRLCA